ncbi:MAG: sorbosone dehydrogenase family protein [Halobacteriaceae archaeon]
MATDGAGGRRTTRRGALATVGGVAAALATGPVAARAGTAAALDSPLDAGPTVALDTVARGFTSPVGVAFSPGESTLHVVDQPGEIYAARGRGLEPFLDIRDRVVDVSGYSERGLLGLAFHPDYATNGRFYVRYSAPSREGTPSTYSHTFVLSEFRADAGSADPGSERTLLELPEPQSNHNAGAVTFGPDGYLYVATGDGGAGGDQGVGHAPDWYEGVAGGNGQDVTENRLGSILRIDVDGRESDRPYAVPDDNPLIGRPGYDEQYAWGFRNPWRMGFSDGRLFAADVGQNAYEEVDIVRKGGNYGWNVREGTHCYATQSCPDQTPDGDPLVPPIVEYPHRMNGQALGRAVVGGYVADTDSLPDLRGQYVFGDWSASFSKPRGRLFAASPPDDGGLWPMQELPVAGASDGRLDRFVLAFGRDPAGELYVATTERGGVSGSTGAVHRLTDPALVTTTDATSTVGGTGDGRNGGDATTEAPGTPGFGALTGLAGVGAAAAGLWARHRRD